MAILNYTTEVQVLKTVGLIHGLLVSKGARSIQTDYDVTGETEAIRFTMIIVGQNVTFRLPADWPAVEKVMKADPKIPSRFKNRDQAKRVAWRIVKDWVEAQMAFIESGQVRAEQVFLPYAIDGQTGQTLFQKFEQGLKLLPGIGETGAGN